MNEKIKQLAKEAGMWRQHYDIGEESPAGLEKFAELILRECIDIAEAQAMQSTRLVHSGFLTEHGKMLHEGMFGGAMNVALGIRERFDLKDN